MVYTPAEYETNTTKRYPCLLYTSGTVLYEKNADDRRPIASITKVMTLLLTLSLIHL